MNCELETFVTFTRIINSNTNIWKWEGNAWYRFDGLNVFLLQGERGLEGPRGSRGPVGPGIRGDKVNIQIDQIKLDF